MTIGLIISRGIYSSIRRRLVGTNPRPIASKFSLERVVRYSLKKEEKAKSIITFFRSYIFRERIDSIGEM